MRLPGLEGRRALVTGGSRGIGRATVRLLAENGASVGIAYHTAHDAAAEAAHEARQALGLDPEDPGLEGEAGGRDGDQAGDAGASDSDDRARVWTHAGDLGDEAAVEELFGRVDRDFGGELDVFVGNAGIWNQEPRPLSDLPAREWDEMQRVNLRSIYLTTRAAIRRMGTGGRVILLSSTAGQRGEPDHSHYAATKGAILSFTKSLAGELGPSGINVNAVAPGWVDTDMSAAVLRSDAREEVLEEIPLRRVATAEDVAGPVVFLASDLAAHVTGEVLNVNGGAVLCG